MPRLLALLTSASLLAACAQSVTATQRTDDAGAPADAPIIVDAPIAIDAGSPVPVDAPRPDVDGGLPPVTDDCLRGTWCWERPVPTGETVVAAVTPAASSLAFVTEGGTLASFDGTRWTTRLLTLPGQATGLFVGADGEVVVTVVEPISQRQRWIVELRGDAQRVIRLEGGGYVSNPQAGGDALWAAGSRELFRRRGATWERIAGPAGSPVIGGLRVVGPDEVIALESWGSGSGTGVLHRYRAGAWEVLVDFRPFEYRVEGPIVAQGGALWMRTYDTGAREPGVIRVVGAEVQSVELPRGLGSINLYSVGDAVWLVDGARAWAREGDDWTPVTGFPGRAYGVIVGFSVDVAWVLSNGLHRRRRGEWERVGEPDQPTGNFWDFNGQPSLVSYRPAGFLTLAGMPRPSWRLDAFDGRGDVRSDSPPVDGVGYLDTADGVIVVRGGALGESFSWPRGMGGGGAVMGGSAAGVWAWAGDDRLVGRVDGTWSDVEGPAFADAPRAAGYTVNAVQYTADARLFVAATMVTGDKQVRRRVFVREGDVWRQVAAEMGVFGRTEGVFVVGDRAGEMWLGLSGLYRYDGMVATLVAPDLDVQALSRRADGGVVLLTPTTVETYSAGGSLLGRVDLPPVRAHFTRVHRSAASGTVRVANASGQVMRYTP
ncbi:MAG: hypothetical protein EPO40_29080 [Myxococcaceae bacterium]|nr:MAG: hypothetical protein EPO40_29080 [Myxococcaceae bacterium]